MIHRLLKTNTFKRWPLAFMSVTLAFFANLSLNAQQDEVSGEVFELSPFTVEPNEGWVAENTLAGSRLNTNLRDVAAQIEVITMDFMDDFALNSIEDAAIYSTNLEAATEIVTGTGLQTGASGNIRVRGLASATNSKEFFAYRAPSDNYNLDRVTISAGPSSILFGTGSPAGVINSTLKRAQFSDFGKLKVQADDWNGHRVEFDYNKVLVEDKLALRTSMMNEDKAFGLDPSGQDSTRFYGTLTWKPFENTTINFMYENVAIRVSRPSRLLPYDYITPWYESETLGVSAGGSGGGYPNQFIFPNSADWAANGAGLNLEGVSGQQLFENTNGAPIIIQGQPNIPIARYANRSVQIRRETNWDHVPNINREADGYTLLNDKYFPTDVNTVDGNRYEQIQGNSINLFLNQKLFENAYFEFGYQKESFDEFNSELMGYLDATAVRVDPNQYLPDGVTPNPNAGRTYFEASSQYQRGEFESEDWRAAISYEFDFQEKTEGIMAFLGRHRLAALMSSNETENWNQVYRYSFIPTQNPGAAPENQFTWPDIDGINWGQPYALDGDGNVRYNNAGEPVRNNRWIENVGSNRVRTRSYVGGNAGFVPTVGQVAGQPWVIADQSGHQWLLDPENTGFYDDNGNRRVNQARSTNGLTTLDTKQFSYQGFFWDGRIVGTYGYRDDEVDAASKEGFNRDSWTGLWQHLGDLPWGEFNQPDSGITRTKGVVAHPLRGYLPGGIDIGVFYNESDTFQPSTNAFGPFGDRYPGALGDGEDKGILLSANEGKFSLRYNKFENSSGPARAANTPFNRIRWQISPIENRLQGVAPSMPTIIGNGDAFPILGNGDPYWVVSFKVATGEEISANWKVTENLDIRLNWTQQEVTESNIGLEWWDWIAQREPVWANLSIPEGGEGNPRDLNGDGTIGTWTWNTTNAATDTYPIPWQDNNPVSDGGESVKERWERIVVNGATGINVIQALDGKSNEFVRDNRWNINASYRFTEGRFKGLTASAAARYRGKPLISYGAQEIPGAGQSIDLSQPLYGEDELDFDSSFRYRGKSEFLGDRNYIVGLAIRNVLDDDDDIVSLVNINGDPIRLGRKFGRQIIASFEIEL
jgi:hypothetical protein